MRAKKREPLKVILDTSFLFIPFKFHVDLLEDISKIVGRRSELIIISPMQRELEQIAKVGTEKLRRQAILAQKLIRECRRINVIRGDEESTDDVILRVAAQMKCYVATNDKALRKRLRRINIPVIYLRQKTHLAMDGALDL